MKRSIRIPRRKRSKDRALRRELRAANVAIDSFERTGSPARLYAAVRHSRRASSLVAAGAR